VTAVAPYPRLSQFSAPARNSAEIWRTLAGVVGISVLYMAFVFGALSAVAKMMSEFEFARLVAGMVGASTPVGLSLTLGTFIPMLMAVVLVAKLLHGRDLSTLIGRGALRDFVKVSAPLLLLVFLMMPLSLLNPDVGAATPFAVLLRWLPVALPLLLIQVTAEEVVFRGYLLQQLGARSARPLVWMALPSALFGVLHYAPGDFGANAIWPALWAFVFGCLAADLTARTGNLGAALAMHFATNFSSIFLVGLYGNLDGLALYTLVINNRDLASLAPYLATDFAAMLVSWLLARLMLRV